MKRALDLLVFGAAGLQLAWAGLIFATGGLSVHPELSPPGFLLLQIIGFAASGWALTASAGYQAPERNLGIAYLIVASAFAFGIVANNSDDRLSRLILGLPLLSLLPIYVWWFVAEFPKRIVSDISDRIVWTIPPVCLVVGLALLAMNAAYALGVFEVPSLVLSRDGLWFNAFVWPATILAFPVLLWRVRYAVLRQRRQTRLFAMGLLVPGGLLCLFVLGTSTVPAFAEIALEGSAKVVLIPLIHLCLVAMPIATAYSVLVDRTMVTSVSLQEQNRYRLGQLLSHAIILAPLLALAWYLWSFRDATLAQLLADGRFMIIAAAIGATWILIRLRRRAGRAIDRAFFGEAESSHDAIDAFLEQASAVVDVGELAAVVTDSVQHRLLVGQAAMLVEDRGLFRDPLDASRTLTDLEISKASSATTQGGLTAIDLEGCPLAALASGSTGRALIAVGERANGKPLSQDDARFLHTIARLSAASLAELRSRSGTGLARYCPSCAEISADAQCSTCAIATVQLQLPLDLGGKYRLERFLGHGGMGIVVRARDRVLDRKVALKTISAVDRRAQDELIMEARTMAKLAHPHLAMIYAVEEFGDLPIIVEELFEGGTLDERIRRAPMSEAQIVSLGVSLLGGLAALHRQGILHRDVKPANIGLTANETPKLLDFGLSVTGDENWVTTIGRGGTPAYYPPEGTDTDADVHFDLWAMACVLLEVAHPDLMPTKNVPRRPKPLLDTPLERILAKALQFERGKRYGTASEFADALAGLS